jgi:predicted nucleotidyltransferase
MNSKIAIEIPRESLSTFCRENGIRRLSVFGSALGEHFTPESDVDMLVEFEPGQVVGLLRMAALERELSEIIGRQVDLRTPADLSRYFRDKVMATAVEQYEG